MRLARYLFDLCYEVRCSICNDEKIREPVNRILYDYYKGEKREGRTLSFRFILDYFESQGSKMPALPSLRRHYDNHFVYYLNHQSEIPEKLILEYEREHKEYSQVKEKDETEIERRTDAIENGSKIHDIYPLTGYNSTTGSGGDKLTWSQWCYKFLKIKLLKEDGSTEVVPMSLPKHAEDLLYLIDKYFGLLLLIARGHLKSTILQIYCIRKLCDYQAKFLYIGGSKDEVIRYTENIRSELKENAMILLYYGYLPHPVHGDSQKGLFLRTQEREFDKDAHLTYATPPTNNKGSSKLGGHSDYIILDDIQGEDTVKSDKLLRKHEDWIDRNILPMRKGRTKIIIAGTRKSSDDIYGYIKSKSLLFTIEKPAIIKFPNGNEEDYKLAVDDFSGLERYEGGQSDPIEGDPNAWHYNKTISTEEVGDGHIVKNEVVDGVCNLKGGEVFWNEFRKDAWDTRTIKYRNPDGSYNKTLMTLQELLLEKYYLEAKQEKGHFSFWSEYQLNPIEIKGRHFDVIKLRYFSKDMWQKIVEAKAIPKFTWVDVGYSLPDNAKQVNIKDVKKGKTVIATLAEIDARSQAIKELGFKEEESGIYILEIRSGNYFIEHENLDYSLIAHLCYVNDFYHPQVICFESNFFGKYIKENVAVKLYNAGLPFDHKPNTMDKLVRISNGMNTRLANPTQPLYVCKETMGYGKFLVQITEFPYAPKIDEIDAVESCDRLLIRKSGRVVLLGEASQIGFGRIATNSQSTKRPIENDLITKVPLSVIRNRSFMMGRRGGYM